MHRNPLETFAVTIMFVAIASLVVVYVATLASIN